MSCYRTNERTTLNNTSGHHCAFNYRRHPVLQGVEEISALLSKAKTYYDDMKKERPAPDRLGYVHAPRNAAEAEQAKIIARAVGDAQVVYRRTLSHRVHYTYEFK